MTKAELINEIKNRIGFDTDNETYAMSKDERDFYTSILKILKQEPCDDCVSRQAVNDLYDRYHPRLATHVYEFGEELKALPSVTPKRKQGEWIKEFNDMEGEVRFYCSSCGDYQMFETDFCSNCGAKMVEPQESEGEC